MLRKICRRGSKVSLWRHASNRLLLLCYFNLSCLSLYAVWLQTSQRMDVGNLGQLMDEIEIKSLLVRERYYRDTCQWQKLRESYHPDASKTSIDISWYVQTLCFIGATFCCHTGTEQGLPNSGSRATSMVLCQVPKPCLRAGLVLYI